VTGHISRSLRGSGPHALMKPGPQTTGIACINTQLANSIQTSVVRGAQRS
jgi:hypothetical protein